MYIKIKINGKKYKFKKVNRRFFWKYNLGYHCSDWKGNINYSVTSKHSQFNFKKGVKLFHIVKH
jgi:hypothetical protein